MAEQREPIGSYPPEYDPIEDARVAVERAYQHGQMNEAQRDTLGVALDTLALVRRRAKR